MSQTDVTWDVKLARLQEQLRQTNEDLATTLGISTRTLSECRREGASPSQPIQRLIDLLLGEGIETKVESNLIVIHSDFRVPEGDEPAKMIVEMHAAGGGAQRDNEFHYISVDSNRIARIYVESLVRMRIQPHILTEESALLNSESRDCYFTALVIILATQATRRNLSHITIAADISKFWPLARELKEILGVDITFIREVDTDLDSAKLDAIRRLGINIASPSGRKSGFVQKLVPGLNGNIPYGFIIPIDSLGNPMKGESNLFFSFRHMRKGRDGMAETDISRLNTGDLVTFSIGMNNKGICATDVALIEVKCIAPEKLEKSQTTRSVAKTNKKDLELIRILDDAIKTCASEDGLALLSRVGSRANIVRDGFKEILNEAGYPAIKDFIAQHSDRFEYFPDGSGSYTAACLRLTTP